MSSKTHNKKRNVGLVYEFLVRLISSSLVEGDTRAKLALGILKKHFKPGTELYKEFRLLNSLMKVSVSSEAVASSILTEAKSAARGHDVVELERQKSLLIRDINHKLADETFWDQPVSEYKMYATIQTLINDWRNTAGVKLERLAEYEGRLVKWLTEAKQKPEVAEELSGSPGENRLVFKLMMKKLNEKYGCSLTSEQKNVLREYVFMTSSGRDSKELLSSLTTIKESVSIRLARHLAAFDPQNKYMLEKLTEAKKAIDAEPLTEVNDAVLIRFMLYMKLSSELDSKD